MLIDKEINTFFDNFKRSYKELITSQVLRDYIINNFTIEEKAMFLLRVVAELSFYEIAEKLDISYRQAQTFHQKIAEKLDTILYEVDNYDSV